MDTIAALREQLGRFLAWSSAHAGFDGAVEGIPPAKRGVRPAGLPHSPWELLEHVRIAQRDILAFCRDPAYSEPEWPADYWPDSPAPPDAEAWERSVAAFRADREAMQRLARDGGVDLFAAVPNGTGQTFLREILLVADHTAYHVGQLVQVRRLLGAWPASE
ncbi:MAG TPA: DinB family protein [Longimicrobiaceae bacterium]|nr:DinB family protein [Longimicrobiaceae bacterium]